MFCQTYLKRKYDLAIKFFWFQDRKTILHQRIRKNMKLYLWCKFSLCNEEREVKSKMYFFTRNLITRMPSMSPEIFSDREWTLKETTFHKSLLVNLVLYRNWYSWKNVITIDKLKCKFTFFFVMYFILILATSEKGIECFIYNSILLFNHF